MNVMKKAWEIAREGQKKFGGKVSEYFAKSLKIAWEMYRRFIQSKKILRIHAEKFRNLALEAKKYNPNTKVLDVEDAMNKATVDNIANLLKFFEVQIGKANLYLNQLRGTAVYIKRA